MPNLIVNEDGNAYWKGELLHRFKPGEIETENGQRTLKELERRCKLLEANKITPTIESVIWDFPDEYRLSRVEETSDVDA